MNEPHDHNRTVVVPSTPAWAAGFGRSVDGLAAC